MKQTETAGNGGLAEGAGFEPAMELPPYTLSRRAPSTARPPLRATLFAPTLSFPAGGEGRVGVMRGGGD